MSKLSKAILAKQGRPVGLVVPTPPVYVTADISEVVPYAAYEYAISAEFRVRTQCSKADLGATTAAARRHIIEGVFGEFRAPIQDVYEKLFDRDIEGAMRALSALETQMFEDSK